MQPKKDTPAKKEKAAKESKPQEKKEKKEKKKEEKKPAPEDDDMDASEAALAAEPKAKDPFAHLPKRYKHFDAFFFLVGVWGYLTWILFKSQLLIEMVTLADENILLALKQGMFL